MESKTLKPAPEGWLRFLPAKGQGWFLLSQTLHGPTTARKSASTSAGE
jgi:hypothetical protein